MTRYKDLYHHVQAGLWPDEVIEEIKLKYKDKISSNRQLSACCNLKDILYILEKRDEINEENYVILEEMYVLLRDVKKPPPQQNGSLENNFIPGTCCSWVGSTVKKCYIKNVKQPCFRRVRQLREEVRVLPVVPTELYDRLEQVISLKIGHKWKDFARGLGVLEGQIDDLEDRHKRISDRIREVLKFHKENSPRQFLYSYIYQALCIARRKDLALDVQHIIDTH